MACERPGCRLLVKFAVRGDLRFIAHRDTLRLFGRALVRARLPVAYSRGFNPHVRLSILVPRSVGMTAEGDYAVIQLGEAVEVTAVHNGLGAQMPAGASVLEVRRLLGGCRPRPAAARYTLGLPAEWPIEVLQQRVSSFLACSSWPVEQPGRKGAGPRPADPRRYVADLALSDSELSWSAVFQEGRSASPREVCQAVGLPWDQLRYTIIRTHLVLELH